MRSDRRLSCPGEMPLHIKMTNPWIFRPLSIYRRTDMGDDAVLAFFSVVASAQIFPPLALIRRLFLTAKLRFSDDISKASMLKKIA